jgi:signal transduction histidine kinase
MDGETEPIRAALSEAGVEPFFATSVQEARSLAAARKISVFFCAAALLRAQTDALLELRCANVASGGYVVAMLPEGEPLAGLDADSFARLPLLPEEVHFTFRSALALLGARTMAQNAERELAERREDMARTEEYLNNATAQLVEMAAQLQGEILRNKALEATNINLAKVDTILQATATLRHEVNNPLFAITGSAERALKRITLLQEKGVTEVATVMPDMVRVLKGAERIQQVINAFSRVVVPTTKDYLPGMLMLELDSETPSHDSDAMSVAS